MESFKTFTRYSILKVSISSFFFTLLSVQVSSHDVFESYNAYLPQLKSIEFPSGQTFVFFGDKCFRVLPYNFGAYSQAYISMYQATLSNSCFNGTESVNLLGGFLTEGIRKFGYWQYWIFLSEIKAQSNEGEFLNEDFIQAMRRHIVVLVVQPSRNSIVSSLEAIKFGTRLLFAFINKKVFRLCIACQNPEWEEIDLNLITLVLTEKVRNFQKRCFNIKYWKFDNFQFNKFSTFSWFMAKQLLDEQIAQMDLVNPKLRRNVRVLPRKSSLLVTKYLMKHFNLSVMNCYLDSSSKLGVKAPSSFPIDMRFKLVTLSEQLASNAQAYLIDTGGHREVKFLSSQTVDDRVVWTALIGPLGLPVFISTVLLIALLILILYIMSRIAKRYEENCRMSLNEITSAIVRPLFDQCLEDQLPSKGYYFRLVLIVWLYYCLLVSETYRSELTSHLTSGGEKIWAKTFADLFETSGDHLFGSWNINKRKKEILPADFDYDHITELRNILRSEYELNEHTDPTYSKTMWTTHQSMSNSIERYRNFNHKKNASKNEHPFFGMMKAIVTGKACLVGFSTNLHAVNELLEQKYGHSLYHISDESVKSRELWSVSHGPLKAQLLESLRWLKDTGILPYIFKARENAFRISSKKFFKERVFPMVDAKKWTTPEFHEDDLAIFGKPQVLRVKHILCILLVLAVGLALAVVVYVIENIYVWAFKAYRKYQFVRARFKHAKGKLYIPNDVPVSSALVWGPLNHLKY